MSREKFKGEPTYRATDAWRRALRAWLDKEGYGSRTRLAKAVGVNRTMLNHLLDGSVDKSTSIGPISRHCNIPYPIDRQPPRDRIEEMSGDLREIEERLGAAGLESIAAHIKLALNQARRPPN